MSEQIQNPKKKINTRIIAVLIAVLVIAGSMSLFSGCGPSAPAGASRASAPEQFLQESIERSGLDAQGGFMQAQMNFSPFDFERFSGVPVEHSFSFTVDEFSEFSDAVGFNAALKFLMDREAGNYLLNMDAGMGGFAFRNNRLFISEDMVALSVPDLYARHTYLYVNPATFIRELNDSEFREMLPIDLSQAEFNMALGMINAYAEMLSGMFDMDALMESEDFQRMMEMSDELLMYTGDFLDEGDMEITVGDATYNVAKLGYYIPEEAMDEFMSEFMAVYVNLLRDYMGGFFDLIAQLDPTMSADDIWDEMFDVMDSIRFPGGLTVFYYVDLETGLVRRSSLPDMTMFIDDGWRGVESTVDLIMEYRGERQVWDVTYYFITMTEGRTGETAEIEIRMYMPDGGPHIFYMEMDMGRDGTMVFDMGYDPGEDEDNIWFLMNFRSLWTNVAVEMRGNAAATAEKFVINDGKMTVREARNTLMSVDFEYGLREVSPEDVTIDRSQAVNFFSLNMDQLQGDLMMALVRLAMF